MLYFICNFHKSKKIEMSNAVCMLLSYIDVYRFLVRSTVNCICTSYHPWGEEEKKNWIFSSSFVVVWFLFPKKKKRFLMCLHMTRSRCHYNGMNNATAICVLSNNFLVFFFYSLVKVEIKSCHASNAFLSFKLFNIIVGQLA